jgi:hypothetical protein
MKKFSSLFIFFIFFLSGCAAAPFIVTPIITGIIYWKEGEARKYYSEPSSLLHRAAIYALDDLNHEIKSDVKNTDKTYEILAGDEHKFKITIKNIKPNISEVKIRVDFLGDKPYAELLYKHIDAHTNTVEYDDNGLPTKNVN